MPENLVILESGAALQVRAAVAAATPILHSGSDRVFAVTGDEAALRRIPQIPGVLQVLTGEERDEQLPVLDDSDLLFARAWLLARQPKHRRADGLPWDAPGFLPPDKK